MRRAIRESTEVDFERSHQSRTIEHLTAHERKLASQSRHRGSLPAERAVTEFEPASPLRSLR